MKINQINGLNRQARRFLLEHCISKKYVEVMAFAFNGSINSQTYENETLIRINGKWEIFKTKEQVLSINGAIDSFQMTKNTIL